MHKLIVDFSHTDTSAIADVVALIQKAGCGVRFLMARPNDTAAWDGGNYESRVRQAKPSDIPENLAEWLDIRDATITVSHDLGVGYFRADDDPKVIFGLKSFLEIRGFSYVIAHSEATGTISDYSGVTEFHHAA
ncbi:hypothetical protein [Methylobacterium komagatae]